MSKDNISETFKALMPFVVASTMMGTFRELEWQWKLADHMNAVFGVAMLAVADGVIRALVGPELEKKGLSPLKDWHWQAFRQETMAKSYCMVWIEEFEKMCREAVEREIIRRFVWEGE